MGKGHESGRARLRGAEAEFGKPVAEFQRPKLLTVTCFLYSAPWAGSGPLPRCPCWKRKLAAAFPEDVEDQPAAEAEDVWIVESVCELKMTLKRQRVSSVLPEHHEVFNRMLGEEPPPPASSNPMLKKHKKKLPVTTLLQWKRISD